MGRYINIPLVGEFFVERTINAKGRAYIDGAKNKGGVELFIGRTHLIIDKPQTEWLPAAVVVLAMILLVATNDTAMAHVGSITDHVHALGRHLFNFPDTGV